MATDSWYGGRNRTLKSHMLNFKHEAENKQEVGPPQCPTSFSKLGAKCTNA